MLGNNSNTATNGNVSVDYRYDGIVLSNESDSLTISFGATVLDQVMWDDGATMPDVSGRSMQLDVLFHDSVSNDTADYWCAPDQATPGVSNGLCSALSTMMVTVCPLTMEIVMMKMLSPFLVLQS